MAKISQPRSMGSMSRLPSTRWQRWAGSDQPMGTFERDAQTDKSLGRIGKPATDPLDMDEVRPAEAPRRQYLKSGKYIGTDMRRMISGGRK